MKQRGMAFSRLAREGRYFLCKDMLTNDGKENR